MYHFFYGLSSCIQNTCNITGQSVNSDSELEVLVAAPGSDYTSMHNNSHEPLAPIQGLVWLPRRITSTLASMLLQTGGIGKQLQALLALTLKACGSSVQAPVREQRHPLRKRLAAAAAVKGFVKLMGAEMAAAVAALGERGRAQVAAVGPLPGVLAHVDDE